jgi:RNA polymerase subunit RPABC4/transcription elongation factor Spt4
LERKCISQIDKKSSPQNQVNDQGRDTQVGTKAGGNSNQHPGLQQSGETVLTTINPRDAAFTGLLRNKRMSIAAATRLTERNIDFDREEVIIDKRRVRVKLSCPHCRKAVRRHHRFCPDCGVELNEPVQEKAEWYQQRVIPLDPATISRYGDSPNL